MMRWRTTGPLVLLLVVAACEQAQQGPPGVGAPEGPAVKAATSPRSQAELPTTAPSIAINNLEGELVAALQMLDRDPHSLGALVALTSIHLLRGKLYGRLAEYDLAATMAERAVTSWPKEPKAWLARAAARSRLHDFKGALADLDRAAKLGGDESGVEVMQRRASILQATGRLAEARPIIEKLARMLPSVQSIGTLATLDADVGDTEKAEREFTGALDHFREVSPFPLAWLWLQQANMWEAEGSPARAGELLAAAHERLPVDASVLSHLAGAEAARGDRARAIALLRPLAASSDDPEYTAQLAQLLGESDEARQLRARASRGYDELLARHPAAFADHAARFFLASSSQLPRALELAELNLRLRQTAEAYALVAEAALANKDNARACAVAGAAAKRGARSIRLEWLSKRAFSACAGQARYTSGREAPTGTTRGAAGVDRRARPGRGGAAGAGAH
jgi:tetratricopeptide (TPR) repeat protein